MLKYQNEINALDNCPRDDFTRQKREACRFVFQNPYNEDSFIPVIKLNPKRRSSFNNPNALCDSYALSMFKTQQDAEAFFSEIKKRNPNIGKSIGDSIATGTIEESHGVSGNDRRDGHFSFFPFDSIVLHNNFRIISQLP